MDPSRERAIEAFATALTMWRLRRGYSKKELAKRMGFDASYVSHIEGRRYLPTPAFANRAEAVLEADGDIRRCFLAVDTFRRARRSRSRPGRVKADGREPAEDGLIVEEETATLTYEAGRYCCRIRRQLYNAGALPINYYPVHIMVDRFPHDPVRSRQCYLENPLTWEELEFHAVRVEEPRKPIQWRQVADWDTYKKALLLFGRFPLYQRQTAVIEYDFTVGDDKWGQWFQRHIWLPTRRLTIRLRFPVSTNPMVWGVYNSCVATDRPLPTPVQYRRDGAYIHHEWTTEHPLLNEFYRLEWLFDPAGPHLAGPGSRPGTRPERWTASPSRPSG